MMEKIRRLHRHRNKSEEFSGWRHELIASINRREQEQEVKHYLHSGRVESYEETRDER